MRIRTVAAIVTALIGSPAYAAISIGACGAEASGTATSIEVALPGTFSTGDLLMGFNATIVNNLTLRVNESGWASQKQLLGTSGVDKKLALITKVAAGDSGTQTFDSSEGTSSTFNGVICPASGVHADIVDATTTDGPDTTNSTTYNPSSIDTATAGAVVCTAIKITDIGSPTTVTQPTGYTMVVDPSGSTTQSTGVACKTVASPTTEDPGDWTGLTATSDTRGFTFALKPAATGPVFSAGPTRAAATNGHTIGGTLTGAGTLTAYAVACIPSESAPTAAQIKTGDCGSGADAAIAANEVWTTTVANDFLLTESGAFPIADVYVAASDGTNNTSVTTFADALRSEDASEDIITLTSIDATSPLAVQSDNTGDTTADSAVIAGMAADSLLPYVRAGSRVTVSSGFACDPCIVESVGADSLTLAEAATSTASNVTVTLEAYYNPAAAVSDVIEFDNATSDGKTATWGVDGTLSIAAIGTAYQTLGYNICDVSAACNFSSGPANWGTDDLLHFNVLRPTQDAPSEPIVLVKDQAGQEVYSTCTDPQSLAVTVSSADSAPTGMTLGTDGVLDGTPTAEDETTGTQQLLNCVSASGLWATPTYGAPIFVTDDAITAPNCVAGTVAECLTELDAVRGYLQSEEQLTATYACDAMVAEDDIISQTPEAAGTLTTYEALSVVASLGVCQGVMSTTFTSSAIPATAVYIRGTAYTPAGARYVSACTTPAVFLAGVGHTTDGATCIDTAGTIVNEIGGWPVTSIGEVVAAQCEPDYSVQGVPRSIDGPVCMSDIN